MKILLKKVRTEKHMTMRQLAKLSGIHNSEISLIENGRTVPTVQTMCLLAKALGVKLCDLVKCD